MTDRLHLTFEPEKVAAPVVCQMAKQFNIVFSIRRANIELTAGWMDLSLEGEESEIQRAIAWLESQGVLVGTVGGDVLAG